MTSGTDDDGSVDGVRVHAGLIVVVHGYESPVRDNTGNAYNAGSASRTGNEVFDGRGVEEFDVRE